MTTNASDAVQNNSTNNSTNITIFAKLDKFSGQNNEDLTSWFRRFDRCCVIAGKDDDLVKGQLLMLCLSGQGLAVADRLEEEKRAPQKYTELKARLTNVFNSEADKECKQIQFENRHSEINETDDEFMLELIKLYRAANPNAEDAQVTCSVKRKFLSGIPAELKRNIYIFCNDPHDVAVSTEKLLEATRKARLLIMEANPSSLPTTMNVVDKVNECKSDPTSDAINRLTETLNTHIRLTNEQLKTQEEQINAITDRNMSRGARNFSRDSMTRFNDNRRQGNWRNSNRRDFMYPSERRRGESSNANYETVNRGNHRINTRGPVICYKCNQQNHLARNCMALESEPTNSTNPLNYYGRQ